MYPGERDEEIRTYLKGLERMAGLYKRAKKGGKGRSKTERALKMALRGQFKELRKAWRVEKAGLDGIRPTRSVVKKYREDDYFRPERIAVYTALFGAYDAVEEPVIKPDNVDYYIVTDQARDAGSLWQAIDPAGVVPSDLTDPVFKNRWCKMHPDKLFPDYEYSIYLDSNFLIVSDLTPFVGALSDYPVAMFGHKNRDCVYEEIKACILKEKDRPEALRAHEAELRRLGVPAHGGLLEAPVIVRRHHDPRCLRLMETWWTSFGKFSRRDQIALIESLWKEGIPIGTLGSLGPDFTSCDKMIILPHGGTR